MCRLDERQRVLAADNIKLVNFVLKKMGVLRSDRDYDDLFGAGCVGLCNAARVFKEDGSAFSTFAFHIIKHEILSAKIQLGSDCRRLVSLDSLYDSIPAPECGFEEIEYEMQIDGFCRFASQNLGESAAAVRLLAEGKSSEQTAGSLGISLSAVSRARKKARAGLAVWLSKGDY